MKRANGTGSVYKNTGNRRKPYYARKTIGYDENGKQLFVSVGSFSTREEAERALIEEWGSNVYFISDGEFVKIGKAKDVNRRVRELQTANPRKLTILKVIECKDEKTAFDLEHFFHQQFKLFKCKGEWFDFRLERSMK